MGTATYSEVDEFIDTVNKLSDICHSHNVLASQKRLYEAYWRLAGYHCFDAQLDHEIQLTLESLSMVMAHHRTLGQADQNTTAQIEEINDGLIHALHGLCLQMRPKNYSSRKLAG